MNPIIEENARRRAKMKSPYNPLTGEGCNGERFLLSLKDSPIGDIWLPTKMRTLPQIERLISSGSIRKTLSKLSSQYSFIDTSDMSFVEAWLNFCELRMTYDFEYFAHEAETIKHKMTGDVIRFTLNSGQRKILSILEDARLSGKPIRLIVLKARQWGSSTLIQMYMLWIQMMLRENWNSVICAHEMGAARTIRAMYKLCIDEMPIINGTRHEMTPFEGAPNIKQIEKRGCRITIASAENPESVRSQDVKMAHFSEIPMYPKTENTNTEQLVGSIVSSVPSLPMTMIIYESTAKGVGDFFHKEYVKAEKGLSSFVPAFVSWFEIEDWYLTEFNGYYNAHTGRSLPGGYEEFIKEMSDYELNLFKNNEAVTLEHLNWYRHEKSQVGDLMQQEFPSDAIEAFKDSDVTVFRADHVEALRSKCDYPIKAVGVMTAEGDASMAKVNGISLRSLTRNVRFIPDDELLNRVTDAKHILLNSSTESIEKRLDSKLVIWKHPDTDITVNRRYIVVYDPQRGLTEKADWGVITVIDRYWRMYGGKSEIVAEWRGHTDKDISIWIAVQIAIFYCNALLVVESNTFDSSYNKEDGTEYIFDTISSCYSNLYSRTEPDKIKEGIPARYGFHTNKNTKPAIIADYVSTIRERAYIERSHRTLDQARVYERRKDGTYGAKEGHHDDDLITRMIGLYIDYHDYNLPETVEGSAALKNLSVRIENESSFS